MLGRQLLYAVLVERRPIVSASQSGSRSFSALQQKFQEDHERRGITVWCTYLKMQNQATNLEAFKEQLRKVHWGGERGDMEKRFVVCIP